MRYTSRVSVPVPAAELFRWHERPGAFQRLTPPWQPVSLKQHQGIRDGDRAIIRLGADLVGLDWVAEHRNYQDGCLEGDGPCGFEDVQISGPFGSWHHRHRMLPAPVGSVLEDDITYTLPLDPVSRIGAPIAKGQLERLFAYRHRITGEDLRRHHDASAAPMTVAVTGASGTIGSALSAFLTGGGHTVVRLVRHRDDATSRGPQDGAVYWNVHDGEIDLAALEAAAPDVVIHLAGEPVTSLDGSAEARRRIWESRTKGTQLLSRALASMSRPPRALVCASASGYYGDRGSAELVEDDAPGDDFLARVTVAWEASTAEAEAAGIRVAHARIGLVTTPAGGLLKTLAPITALGLGGWTGDGDAWWPWIALDDVVYVLHWLALEDARGSYNLAAPSSATMKTVVKTLASVQNRPAVVRVPEMLVRTLGGELARSLALKSTRMVPDRLVREGFRFSYPDLRTALAHVTGHLDAHTLS
ncbi:TIGR01777 family oxidoreductase [Rubrivirga sp.]|uniref:TIGR01777 family oxidoreductase n=1 Tax=Rubrivirga sp. TaxID=1885344 RepID=UPI003C747D7F